jgi:NitT/TauT family transport system ATP-binding protein
MSILSCHELRKSFALNGQPLAVLDGISFAVDEGEVVVIVGQSGSGKSTLLRILAGLIAPDSGDVRLGSTRLTSPTTEIGLLFQNYTVFPWMSVVGNVEAGLLHHVHSKRERRRVALDHLNMVGLAPFAHSRPDTLSGGMQQRVALARTYAMNPRILLMDEPFGALDALTRREMQRELLRINAQAGKAVIFVTHDIAEAVLISSRILVLSTRPTRIIRTFVTRDAATPAVLHQEVAAALEGLPSERGDASS